MTKRQEATSLGEIFNSTMTSYIQDIQELNFETLQDFLSKKDN